MNPGPDESPFDSPEMEERRDVPELGLLVGVLVIGAALVLIVWVLAATFA